MDYDYDGDGDTRIDEAMAFLRWCNDAESNNPVSYTHLTLPTTSRV